MMGWYPTYWSSAGIAGMLIMVAAWGSIVALAVWAIARLTRTDRKDSPAAESARAILDRRLASGEITTTEYERTRAMLESSIKRDSPATSS